MLDNFPIPVYGLPMMKNERLASLRRRKIELEGFREQTPAVQAAYDICNQEILAILEKEQG